MLTSYTSTSIAARKEYETIERCMREIYDMYNSLYYRTEANFIGKEDLIKLTYTEVMGILSAICFDHKFSDKEMQIIGASERYEVSFSEESGTWANKYGSGVFVTYRAPKFIRVSSTVDFKYALKGKYSSVIFHALLKLIEMICGADDDYKAYQKKALAAWWILEDIYSHYESKGIYLRDAGRPVVTSKEQIIENIAVMDKYLSDMDSVINREFALDRIKLGICFVAVKVSDGYRFYPSRFVGYKGNSRHIHELNDKDGRVTNNAIKEVLEKAPIFSKDMEDEYYKYCNSLRIKASASGSWGVERKYWVLE